MNSIVVFIQPDSLYCTTVVFRCNPLNIVGRTGNCTLFIDSFIRNSEFRLRIRFQCHWIVNAPTGVGPGFTAGEDCHCVIETKRGHYLGRCIYRGSAIPNSGVPGNIGGYTTERLLRAPCAGVFEPAVSIGDLVQTGDVCVTVNGVPMRSQIPGVVRGLLQRGVMVTEGMKSGDVDPRCEPEHCHTVSDKARAIGGGVLEAILHLTRKIQKREQ